MVRVTFGTGLDRDGQVEVDARTLSETLDKLEGLEWTDDLQVFVGGVDAAKLEGPDTPVGAEDRVLLTRW